MESVALADETASELADPYLFAYALHPAHGTKEEYHSVLRVNLFNLQSNISEVAADYRELGLSYHAIPLSVIFATEISNDIRFPAWANFVVNANRELPPMVQILGLLAYATRKAAWLLATPEDDKEKTLQAENLLFMANTWLGEGVQTLAMLHQDVTVIKTAMANEKATGTYRHEGKESKAKREGLRQFWCDSIPSVCWKGFVENAWA